ncbi:putative ribonuclease H-like domain-containing protein [Tanacetum coccineum]
MMGIPNEHQLKFNSIKDAKKLLEAVEKRFGGNAATKKTQRNLLKQQYENFTTPSSEMLDQTFDRLQKLVSQLELLDENISQEDVNKKCLTKTLKGVNEPGSKGMSSSSSNTQNMDFVSSSNNNTSNTNEAVNTAHEVSTTSTQVNAANSTNIDNLSDAVICTLLLGQHIGPQLVHEDLQQIHPDDMKLTVNSNKTIGFDKSKVECYNCHKMGHFAREYRAPTLVSCDGLGGYDWSDQAE